MVAVATKEGAYLLTSDGGRAQWIVGKRFLTDEDVNRIILDGDGKMFAATLTEGVFASDDLGKTWKPSSRGLNVRKVWTIEADPHEKGVLYAGTHYGHLFRSTNYGQTWEEVASLHEAPNRKDWGIDWGHGTTGLALHTIKFDITDPKMIYLVAAGNGTYRSDDGGGTWKSLKTGLNSSCTLDPAKLISSAPSDASPEEKLSRHLAELHSDTHKIVVSPKDGRIYQQNHCGVYVSNDYGNNWKDISPNEKNRFGFPIDIVENGRGNVFVVPVPDEENDCKAHNVCIRGQLTVYRTTDSGKSWNKLTHGLPDGVHTNVLRDSFSHDSLETPGIYLGTTTGEVFCSTDLGDSWRQIAGGLGRIQGISAMVV